MTRGQVAALAAGGVSAALFLAAAFGSLGGVILAYLAQLPLFAAGLSAGWPAALVATSTAGLVVWGVESLATEGLFVISTAIPVLILVRLALQTRPASDGGVEWYPPGYLLAVLSGMALGVFAVLWLYFAAVDGGLEAASYRFLRNMMSSFVAMGTPEQLDRAARSLSRYFPGAAFASWQFMVIVNGLLAQGVLARFGRNLRPGSPFTALDLPRWPAFAFAACVVLALFSGQAGGFGRNGAIILCVPFFFVGLSVIHSISVGWRGRPFLLTALYLLLLLARWPVLVVTGLGFAERWAKLRLRLAASEQDGKEE